MIYYEFNLCLFFRCVYVEYAFLQPVSRSPALLYGCSRDWLKYSKGRNENFCIKFGE
jgi:hypothetical protein